LAHLECWPTPGWGSGALPTAWSRVILRTDLDDSTPARQDERGDVVLIAEALVLILIVLLLVVWVVLAILLTAWSMWFQAAIYTEAAPGLAWRGPAAASAVMLVVLVWVVLDYRSPERFRPLWESASTGPDTQFDELRVPGTDREEVYRRRPGTREYRLGGLPSGKPLPSTPPRIVVVEGDQRYTFEPERDEQGNFKRGKAAVGRGEENLRYRDEKGRVMVAGSLGQIESFHGGQFAGNVLLHLAFIGSAFLGLWLLVRFQWLHALGQAAALSLLLLLFVMPPLLTRAEAVARDRAAAASRG
jgi:hypothetical protein